MGIDAETQSVREEFSKLDLDGKTAFLVEAIFSTAGSAIKEIGERVNSLVDLASSAFREAAHEDNAVPSEETETDDPSHPDVS